MELDKAIKERRSIRHFKKTKTADYKKAIEIVDAATKAPLAGNISSLRYIIVQDKEKIAELAKAAQQDFIEEAEIAIVICSDKKGLERSYYQRGLMYSRQQAGAAIENMLLKITELGLASCWVGAFSDETIKRILKIPDNIDVEAILPIGEEMGKTKQPRKPDIDHVLFFDTWGNMYMTPRTMIPRSKT